jgi:hypothetical protein
MQVAGIADDRKGSLFRLGDPQDGRNSFTKIVRFFDNEISLFSLLRA